MAGSWLPMARDPNQMCHGGSVGSEEGPRRTKRGGGLDEEEDIIGG